MKNYHYEFGVFVYGALFGTFKEWHVAHAASRDYEAIGWSHVEVKKTRVYNQ